MQIESASSRRDFIKLGSAALAALQVSGIGGTAAAAVPARRNPVCIFSKHLHFLNWEELAATAAEIGFDGVDLTVRAGGHVEPERVEKDLPAAAGIIRKAGLELPMVTAGIVDTHTPHLESMLQTFHALGIPKYRWGGFKWIDGQSLPKRMEELKLEWARLAEMNRKYNLCAIYHTHSGAEVGASIWDLWYILKDLDGSSLGINYDSAHGTIEGGLGGWIASLRLASPMLKGIAVKDFSWAKNSRGVWAPAYCPLGEGMVDFKQFFALVRAADFAGPVQLHFEYPLGGADKGNKTITIPKSQVVDAMRKDLNKLRGWLRESGLS